MQVFLGIFGGDEKLNKRWKEGGTTLMDFANHVKERAFFGPESQLEAFDVGCKVFEPTPLLLRAISIKEQKDMSTHLDSHPLADYWPLLRLHHCQQGLDVAAHRHFAPISAPSISLGKR